MMKSLEMTSDWFKENIFSIGYDDGIPDDEKLENMLDFYQKVFLHKKGGCIFGNTVLETILVEDTFKEASLNFFQSWEKSLVKIFATKHAEKIAKEKSTQVIGNLQGAIILMILNDEPQYLKDAIVKSKELY
ncbi:MAG: hypothetical protein ACFB0B_20100 [Thermonemataceae bacterium]